MTPHRDIPRHPLLVLEDWWAIWLAALRLASVVLELVTEYWPGIALSGTRTTRDRRTPGPVISGRSDIQRRPHSPGCLSGFRGHPVRSDSSRRRKHCVSKRHRAQHRDRRRGDSTVLHGGTRMEGPDTRAELNSLEPRAGLVECPHLRRLLSPPRSEVLHLVALHIPIVLPQRIGELV